MFLKIDENRCKQNWRVYLDFGRAGSLSLQLYIEPTTDYCICAWQ